jgi:plasmid maintenance system antidote protein VapI
MTSSLKRRSLSKPERGVKIHPFNLGVVRTRNKNKAHSLLLELFEDSNLSKADLAKMLGKKPEQVTRWLAGPANITLDTLSDLIFAMKGEFFTVQCKDELSRAKTNRQSPDWLVQANTIQNWQPVLVPRRSLVQGAAKKSKVRYSVSVSSKSSQEEPHYERYEAVTEEAVSSFP